MPPFFQSWTNCSQPGKWHGQPILAAVVITILAALLGFGLTNILWTVVAAALLGACLGGILWCNWWLNIRLVCLGGDRSAIGVIFSADQESATLSAFDLGHYDTDYTFNLLLWPFVPELTLPASFVGADAHDQFNAHEWDPVTQGNLFGDAAFWNGALPTALVDPFGEPVQDVKNQVQLILPQNAMVNLQRPFTGQPSDNNGNTGGQQTPAWSTAPGSDQQFLLHCEIEGSGVYALRAYLYGLAAVFAVSTAVSAIPVVGPVWSALIDFLAFIVSLFAGPAIQANNRASPPSSGGFGGTLNAYSPNGPPNGPVDVAYCYGRWTFDSFHSGWNEFHPLHFMLKITPPQPMPGVAAPPAMTNQSVTMGNWPPGLGEIKDQYDQQFGFIFSPEATELQRQPQNQWKLHPLLDGCRAASPYPASPPPDALQ